MSEMMKRLLDALLPNRAAPVLARVLKAHEGPGKTKYSVDVRVVMAGTLEDTELVISEVPLSPVWAGQKKRGLYAIPPQGQIVIVEFLGWNPAYPFVAGIWSDDYEADEFRAGQFVLTSGEGMKITLDPDGGKITVENGKSKTELEDGKITADNGQVKIILNGGKASVKNGSKSLFTVLDTLLQNLIGMKAVGSPAQHVVSPDDITKLTQAKTDITALLEA
ncbi:MAG: hypothetical protein MdMp014T_1871 [Treponematales bacterium]